MEGRTRTAARIGVWVAVGLAVVAGLYGRFRGLGTRPLAVDEYYFMQSVGFILDGGLPEFPTGGFYTRGLLIQYLTAASTWFFDPLELAARVPSVLFSLGSVVLAYEYGRRTVGKPAAVAVALALLVSSWQIEFARFARMYAGFQFVTLAFLIAFHDAYLRGRWELRYLPHALVFVGVLTHELGILLAPLLFLPLVASRERFAGSAEQIRFGLAGLFVNMSCLLFEKSQLRTRGVVEALPTDFVPPWGLGTFRLPDFPFWRLTSDEINLIALVGVMLGVVLVFGFLRQSRPSISVADLVAALMLVAAAAHSLLVFGVFLALLVLRYRLLQPGRHPRRILVVTGLSVLLAVAWLVYAWTHPERLGYSDGGPSLPELIRRAFFGWPDFYRPVLLPWFRAFPLLTGLSVLAVLYHLVTKLGRQGRDLLGEPGFFVLYIAFCFGVLESQYNQTRYTFFIYPLVLCMSVSAIVDGLRRLGAVLGTPEGLRSRAMGVALFAGLFLFSSDFNPAHIRRIDSEPVAYRTGEFRPFSGTWYPRLDYRAAARFVNGRVQGADPLAVVVVLSEPVSGYLEGEHAIYYSREDSRFLNVSREGGRTDLWSNRRLLGTPAELRTYTEDASVVWLVGQSSHETLRDPAAVWGERLESATTAFRAVDERLQVVEILLAAEPPTAGQP